MKKLFYVFLSFSLAFYSCSKDLTDEKNDNLKSEMLASTSNSSEQMMKLWLSSTPDLSVPAINLSKVLSLNLSKASFASNADLNNLSNRPDPDSTVKPSPYFSSDNLNVSSDLEQTPHMLNFIKNNDVLLTNHRTPLIVHIAMDILITFAGSAAARC